MNRRDFLCGLALGLLTAPFAADAQRAEKGFHVCVVLEGGPYYVVIERTRDEQS